jgi:hypothetical protein
MTWQCDATSRLAQVAIVRKLADADASDRLEVVEANVLAPGDALAAVAEGCTFAVHVAAAPTAAAASPPDGDVCTTGASREQWNSLLLNSEIGVCV